MLEVRSLRKTFGSVVAVDDVSFSLRKGELVGLLGPNGAGKTTSVSMIAGLLTPDRGEVLIDGKRLAGDVDPAKRRIGLVPQDLALYEELSAHENLRFFGSLYELTGGALAAAIDSVLTLVGLADRSRDAVKTFSGGMKRRLNLAAGLLHDPDILMMVMLGGVWVPSFIFPGWLQQATKVVPVRWAVDGLDSMTWRGLGFGAAVAPTLVLLGFAALFAVVAASRFRWEEA